MSPIPHAWSGLAVAAALLAACSTPAPKPPPPPSLVQNPGHRVLVVTDANAGATVVLESAQTLTVRLPLGATSGLEWSLVDLQPGVVSAIGPKFERALRNTNSGEDAGDSVWQLTPVAAGAVTLNFALRPTRSLQPAVQTVRYDVTVK
jgi:predicted secreted protein